MQHRHWIVLTIAFAIGIGIAFYPGFIDQPPRGANPHDAQLVAQGAALYAKHCASCHGANLEGQANWRERKADGKLPAPPHDASGHTWHHPDRVLFRVSKEGMAWVGDPNYQSDMPAFAGVLSDQEIQAVIAFIKNHWPEPVRAQQQTIDQQDRQR